MRLFLRESSLFHISFLLLDSRVFHRDRMRKSMQENYRNQGFLGDKSHIRGTSEMLGRLFIGKVHRNMISCEGLNPLQPLCLSPNYRWFSFGLPIFDCLSLPPSSQIMDRQKFDHVLLSFEGSLSIFVVI